MPFFETGKTTLIIRIRERKISGLRIAGLPVEE
jgi:hypothetical protein